MLFYEHVCMYVYVCVCMCMCMCVYVCMYVYVCVCMYATYIPGAPLDEQQTLMWHNMLNEVMQDIDQLDDTIFEEGEEEVANRNDIPQAVDCYGLPMPISRALRFLFKTDRKETVNTRYFLSTRSVFAVCLVSTKTQLGH